MPPTDYGKMMRNPVQGMVHIIILSTEIPFPTHQNKTENARDITYIMYQ